MLNLPSWLVVIMNIIIIIGGLFCLLTVHSYMCGLSEVRSIVHDNKRDIQVINSCLRSYYDHLGVSITLILAGTWNAFVFCFEGNVHFYLVILGSIILSVGLLYTFSGIIKEIGRRKGIAMCETKIRRKIPQY